MKDTIKVYWSPEVYSDPYRVRENYVNVDWSILYANPEKLINYLKENKTKESTVFRCPSFVDMIKNTFIFSNPIETFITIKDGGIYHNLNNGIACEINRDHLMFKNNFIFNYKMQWVFITDEPSLEMSVTSPYFSETPHLKYGSIFPGKFDIGKWFRPVNLEYNLWNGNDFHILEGEPLCYIQFNTDKKVELIRFSMNEQLKNMSTTLSHSSLWEKNVPLFKRYKRFTESMYKDKILKEIKSNIL